MTRGVRTAIIIGGVVVGLIIVLSIVSGALWDRGYGWWGPSMMGGWNWAWLMPVFWIVVMGLVIWVVVSAVNRSSPASSAKSSDTALEILRQRYARGEINQEEYEAKRKALAQ